LIEPNNHNCPACVISWYDILGLSFFSSVAV